MNSFNLIIKKGLWLLIVVLGLVACSEEDIHDFTKKTASEASNDIFIADSISTYPVFWSINAEFTGTDTIVARFPICLKEPSVNDVLVTMELDNDLIEAYNQRHGTDYTSILPQYVSISNQKVTIPAGKTVSDSAVSVAYTRPATNLTDARGYLIPVKIHSYSGTDVKISYEKRHGYVVVDVIHENGVFFKETSDNIVAANSTYQKLDTLNFKVNSRFAVTSDTKIQLSLKNDLISAFNSSMGTDYQEVPSGDLPQSYEIVISKGNSNTGFTLNYKGKVSDLNDPRGYVIPLEITSVEGDNIRGIPAGKMLYVVVYSASCQYVVDEAGIGGLKVTDRSNFQIVKYVYADGTVPTAAAGNPGSFLTGGMYVIMPLQDKLNLTIDLGSEVENIVGLNVGNMSADGSNLNIKTMDVGYATNESMYKTGTNIEIGKNIDLSSLPKNSYIKFDKPITARYIMLNNIFHNNGSYLGLNNFNIYTR